MATENAQVARRQRPTPRGFKRPAEFARENGMGVNQVYEGCKRGDLPCVRIAGRSSSRMMRARPCQKDGGEAVNGRRPDVSALGFGFGSQPLRA
jgi:hypothetical protein